MKTIDIEDLQAQVQAKRAELGFTEADDLACRNPGHRRTPEKKALLAAIAARCRAAGVECLNPEYEGWTEESDAGNRD